MSLSEGRNKEEEEPETFIHHLTGRYSEGMPVSREKAKVTVRKHGNLPLIVFPRG